MLEDHNFEKHEIPPQPKVDMEVVLERGVIDDSWILFGPEGFKVVSIKDDGKGLFRSNDKEVLRSRPLRFKLEILAYFINKGLNLDVVPVCVSRPIDSEEGVLQHFVEDSVPGSSIGDEFLRLVSDQELFKAVLFDYLIAAIDRDTANILFNKQANKVWLIDHDDYMFRDTGRFLPRINVLLNEAKRRNLDLTVPDNLRERLFVLRKQLDNFSINDELEGVIAGINQRIQSVLETGTISI